MYFILMLSELCPIRGINAVFDHEICKGQRHVLTICTAIKLLWHQQVEANPRKLEDDNQHQAFPALNHYGPRTPCAQVLPN